MQGEVIKLRPAEMVHRVSPRIPPVEVGGDPHARGTAIKDE